MYDDILKKIGNTPLIRINRLFASDRVAIYAKLESFNPGGSVKDRIALSMIEAGEASGELTPDKTVLEATSGNTGIGLAMVCAVKGYRCQLIMPESASIERRKIMLAYGAEILLTPAKRSTDGAIEQAYAMAREHPELYFLTDQFNNEANWRAHYDKTGPEIWAQTGGRVTDVVATMGTTGTAMGLSKYFGEHHPEVRVIAMEPFYDHKIQGLKNMKESYKPGIFDKTLPAAIVNVADKEAFEMSRQLARREGLFVGMSSGAAMCAALNRANEMEEGFLVVILPDGGEKYLSTPLFDTQKPAPSKAARLRLHNTLTKKKEIFKPLAENKVTLYACGPTAREHAHLAHCRRFIVADLLIRLLTEKGYEVQSCMNFTDLDDNTIREAEEAGKSLREFTDGYIREFMADIETLGARPASRYPRASENVDRMIAITRQLVKRGYAYEKHGSIYFNISRSKGYGRLSNIDLEKIRVGRTVDLDNYEKENPVDFTLLKRSTLGELKKGIFFQTEWGNVRPGWHIECAAMSTHYLGDTMDIHTSERELIFPHHENEIAIAEALTGKPLANYWLHSEMLLVDGKKMAREQHNVLTLRELIAMGYTPREIRYLLMATHYRKPLHFSFRNLDAARKNLKRLDEFTRKILCLPVGLPHPEIVAYVSEMEDKFFKALEDDLNMSRALGAIFGFFKKANPVLAEGRLDREQKNYIIETLTRLNAILNVMRLEECPLAPEIDRLLQDREAARKRKDWVRADVVRDELARHGYKIIDTAKGPVWESEEKAGDR